MDQEESKVTEPDAPVNPQMQMIGRIVNYGLMIVGAVAIVYFIATGKIVGFS